MRHIVRVVVFGVGTMLAGCAVAPLGFYESAFGSTSRIGFSAGGDIGRRYDYIPDDTAGILESDCYSNPLALLGIDFSPIPPLTLGVEAYGPLGAIGGDLKAKATMVGNQNMAMALIAKAGANSAEGDSWGTHYSYNTQHLLVGGIASVGSPQMSVGFGPKLAFAHANISGGNSWYGNVVDYGGFVNGVLNLGLLGLAGEFSLLSVDRPEADKRALMPYGGARMSFRF